MIIIMECIEILYNREDKQKPTCKFNLNDKFGAK